MYNEIDVKKFRVFLKVILNQAIKSKQTLNFNKLIKDIITGELKQKNEKCYINYQHKK